MGEHFQNGRQRFDGGVNIPTSQLATFACECGSKEFLVVEMAGIMYDRIQPTNVGFGWGKKFRCIACRRFVNFTEEGPAMEEGTELTRTDP